jgi:hypothetical protein
MLFGISGSSAREGHAMKEKVPESNPWRSYRRAQLLLLTMFVGWIPVMRAVDALYTRFHLPLAIVILVGIVWVVATCIQGIRVALWPCPYCGKSFRGLLPFLPRKCRNCGRPR